MDYPVDGRQRATVRSMKLVATRLRVATNGHVQPLERADGAVLVYSAASALAAGAIRAAQYLNSGILP
jgi:hypothetical protein